VTDAASVRPHLRVVSAGASAAEVAAVTAVVSGALDELAAQLEVESERGESAWQRSQRPVRGTITPGVGSWRTF